MPDRVSSMLEREDGSNSLLGVIPKLAQLLSRDPAVEIAYLCTEAVDQVHKLPSEGAHFCGYRNMQMLSMAIESLGQKAADPANSCRKPTVLQLQYSIEEAWDRGFNEHGRKQTGGIVGTRKHVGTSEVLHSTVLGGVLWLTLTRLKHSYSAVASSARGPHSLANMLGVKSLTSWKRISKVPSTLIARDRMCAKQIGLPFSSNVRITPSQSLVSSDYDRVNGNY